MHFQSKLVLCPVCPCAICDQDFSIIIRTEQEAERRQRQIETLQSNLIHLQTQFTNAADKDMQRAELLGNGNRPSLWEEDDEDEVMADARPSGSTAGSNKYSVQDYRKQQTKILDDQNEGLEALAKVISRQKHLALRIGDEVDEQNGMCDESTKCYLLDMRDT